MAKRKPAQPTLFQSGEDTPLFSGTAMKEPESSTPTPADAERNQQLELPPHYGLVWDSPSWTEHNGRRCRIVNRSGNVGTIEFADGQRLITTVGHARTWTTFDDLRAHFPDKFK